MRFFRAGNRFTEAIAVTALLAPGCAQLDAVSLGTRADSVAFMALTAAADRESLASLEKDARSALGDNDRPSGRLRLAMILSAPRAALEDLGRGIAMLHDLSGDTRLSVAQRNLARTRAIEARARLDLARQIDSMARELAQSEKARGEAGEKIEELLDIERSMENGRRRNLPETQ